MLTDKFPLIDASGSALNIVVQGDKVLVLVPDGEEIVLSLSDARRSLQRLSDAIAVAEGRVPVPPAA
jgi:predicted ABC-class ATPase